MMISEKQALTMLADSDRYEHVPTLQFTEAGFGEFILTLPNIDHSEAINAALSIMNDTLGDAQSFTLCGFMVPLARKWFHWVI